MKLVKTAEGKDSIQLTKSDWQKIGLSAGWLTTAKKFSGWCKEHKCPMHDGKCPKCGESEPAKDDKPKEEKA